MSTITVTRKEMDRLAFRRFEISGRKIREVWNEEESDGYLDLSEAVAALIRRTLLPPQIEARRKYLRQRAWLAPFSARLRAEQEVLKEDEATAAPMLEVLDWLSDFVCSDPKPVIKMLEQHMPDITIELIPESFEIEGEVLSIGSQFHAVSFARFGPPQLTTYTVAGHRPYYRESHPKMMYHRLVGPNGRDPGFSLSSVDVPLLREGGHEVGGWSKKSGWLDEKAARAAAIEWCRKQIAESERAIAIYTRDQPIPKDMDKEVAA